jgi:hypothetical protein
MSAPDVRPLDRVIAALEAHGSNPRASGPRSYKARCPAHDDHDPSLSVTEGDDGTVLVKCHVGCTADAIVQALDLEMRDLFPRPIGRPGDRPGKAREALPPSKAWRSPEDAIAWQAGSVRGYVSPIGPWIYNDADGYEAMRVYRLHVPDESGAMKKQFRPVYPDADGWHVGDPSKAGLPLYHLNELSSSVDVWVFEGEKCADLARGLGLCATTSSHGAQAPGKTDWSPLAGKTVLLVPDHDRAGEGYATAVAGLLARLDPSPVVKVVRLPLAGEGDDIEQWLETVPDAWGPEDCRAELERLGAAAPYAEIKPRPSSREPCKLLPIEDLTMRNVEWLWDTRVPLGMLTLFAGDPKLGKSFVTLAMAAAVSRGVALPGSMQPTGPGSVLLLSAEDDPARIIKPRLMAAGADCRRIHLLESVYLADGREALPSLTVDLEKIEESAGRIPDLRVIIIDPVTAYLGGVDDHRNAELRGVLSPLKSLAERLGAAIVLVTHLSKGAGVNGKHRVIGSIAYVGACRANFLFIRDRSDPANRRVLMCDNGTNLGPVAPTLGYVITDRGDGPVVEWVAEEIAITGEEALATEAECFEDHKHAPERRAAEQFLREFLADGPRSFKQVRDAAIQSGVSVITLRRAKTSLGVVAERMGFAKNGHWQWRLPGHAERA